jgi:hypothetical protein
LRIWEVILRILEAKLRVCEGYVEGIWRVYGGCVEGIWRVCVEAWRG